MDSLALFFSVLCMCCNLYGPWFFLVGDPFFWCNFHFSFFHPPPLCNSFFSFQGFFWPKILTVGHTRIWHQMEWHRSSLFIYLLYTVTKQIGPKIFRFFETLVIVPLFWYFKKIEPNALLNLVVPWPNLWMQPRCCIAESSCLQFKSVWSKVSASDPARSDGFGRIRIIHC